MGGVLSFSSASCAVGDVAVCVGESAVAAAVGVVVGVEVAGWGPHGLAAEAAWVTGLERGEEGCACLAVGGAVGGGVFGGVASECHGPSPPGFPACGW